MNSTKGAPEAERKRFRRAATVVVAVAMLLPAIAGTLVAMAVTALGGL